MASRTQSTGRAADRLPIVFALEDRHQIYWVYTAIAATSALQYAGRPLEIHVLHGAELSENSRRRLTEVVREGGGSIVLHEVRLPPTVKTGALSHFGPASLYRLMIPRLFRDEPLVLYLDSDVVCNGVDLGELADAIPQGAAVSGVVDRFITLAAEHAQALETLGLDKDGYINSGVLGIRPGLIGDDLLEAFAEFSARNPVLRHPDQDFLNSHFLGRIHHLDERFNYLVGTFEERAVHPLRSYAGKLIHYAAKVKPMNGLLSPGMLPFWVHAYRVPELHQGRLPAEPDRYLLPLEGRPNVLVTRPLPKRAPED